MTLELDHEELSIIHACMEGIRKRDSIDEYNTELPFNKVHVKIMGALIDSYEKRRQNGGLP